MDSPIKSLKKIIDALSPNSKKRKIKTMRKSNEQKQKEAKRKLIYERNVKNKINTAKKVQSVTNKMKKLKI